MKTQIKTSNSNAITGVGYVCGLRMEDMFSGCECYGCVDAPDFVVTGSTIENVIIYTQSHMVGLNGRYVIPSIAFRG